MRNVMLTLAALTFVFSPSFSRAADTPSDSQATSGNTATAPSNNPSSPGTPQAAQMPPANWTSLKGTVQSVDTVAKTVQIQDNTGAVLQVPVDRQVSIQKDGKRIKLTQVQAGDSITLAKRNPSSQEEDKPKTY